MRIHVYVLFILAWCPMFVSMGQAPLPAVLLQDTTRFVPVGRNVTILEDKTARLTFDQVRRRTDFVPSYSENYQYGYTSSAYWFRFEVTNRSQENVKHWLIGLLDAISIDYVDLYLVYPNGRVVHHRGGLKRPYVDQGFFATAPFFRVTFPTNQPVTVFFRIESSLSMYGKVTVWEEYYNLSKGRVIIFVIWMFLGLFILRSLNSFVLARFIPDPQFRFYALCTFLLYISTLSRTGVYSLLLADYPRLLEWMQFGMVRLLPVGLATWMYSLLDGRRFFKLLRWWLLLIAGISLVGVFLPFYAQNAAIGEFFAILVLTTYVLFFIGVVLVWTMGKRPALYLVLPITLCTIPFALYQMETLKIVSYSTLISQLPLLALAIEMVSMSLVLGRIVQSYIKERIATANALLLEKVEVDKLQELGALKTHFFTNISHELRTPLTLIISPLSELKKRFPDEPLLPLMERNSNRLLGLINQLLDMSKLEAGQMKAQPEPGDMATFFRMVISSFESLAKSRQVYFSFSQNETEYQVDFDRDKVDKIMMNLLSNAFKFTPPGNEVRVTVHFSAGTVQVSIVDTGIGIARTNLPYIFDRFYQVDSRENRAYEGTGVGLSLVRELVDVLHGTITVDSAEGVGTTFTLTLPINPVSALSLTHPDGRAPESAEQHWSAFPLVSPPDSQFAPAVPDKILLIIDDNVDIRVYIRSLFATDYQVLEAEDGQEGLAKASVTLPDIVVCDLMMPRLDGFSFCRMLKSQETTSHIPILMLTAKSSLKERVEGFDLGADAYLTKPFERVELLARVRNLVQKQAQLRQYFSRQQLPAENLPELVVAKENAFLQKARAVIDAHLPDADFTVDMFSQQMGTSQSQLVRKLKALTGQTTVEFLRNHRLERAAAMLRQGERSVSEVAYRVGFESLSYSTRIFQEKFGVNPSVYGPRIASNKQ